MNHSPCVQSRRFGRSRQCRRDRISSSRRGFRSHDRAARDCSLLRASASASARLGSGSGVFGVQALFIAALVAVSDDQADTAQSIWFGLARACSGRAIGRMTPNPGRVAPMGLPHSAFSLGLATTIANPRSAISVASIFATTMPQHPSLVLAYLRHRDNGRSVGLLVHACGVLVYCIVALVSLSARPPLDRSSGRHLLHSFRRQTCLRSLSMPLKAA